MRKGEGMKRRDEIWIKGSEGDDRRYLRMDGKKGI